jgi:hypothetical protein
MQMCYQLDNIVCTHAGIGHNWLVTQQGYTDEPIADFVNQIWKHRPNAFIFTGWDPTKIKERLKYRNRSNPKRRSLF